MGWAFRVVIPRSALGHVRCGDGRVLGWGVHGWRGRWLVNGSSHGLVSITIDPPAASRVIGVHGRLHELTVSLIDPDGFVEAVRWPDA